MNGHIDISKLNNPPEKHEFETAKYFSALGKDITFLNPSSIPDVHTPDILMDGIEWEIKCPQGNGKHTIVRNLHAAASQSHNIIFDLRRIKLSEKQCLSDLEREFNLRPYLKALLVIKKNGELIRFGK